MAVPKRKVSPSRRNMRRAHDALTSNVYVEDKDTGELKRPHHIDLKTGTRVWNSDSFGKYASLVAQGDRILALDERGILLLIKADPKGFQLLDQRKVAAEDTWAHLVVCGEEVFVRELRAMSAFRWQSPKLSVDVTPPTATRRASSEE